VEVVCGVPHRHVRGWTHPFEGWKAPVVAARFSATFAVNRNGVIRMRRKWAIFATVIAALLLSVLFAGSSAVGATGTAVPLGAIGFGSIAVDDANSHVFVSGPAANEVLVFDFDGNLVQTIPNVDGATAMLVHGTTLYVVESTVGAIEAIDLDTLTDSGPLATGLEHPTWLVFAGGKLWTTVSIGFDSWMGLASVGLSGTVTTFTSDSLYHKGDLATTATDSNTLYVANEEMYPSPGQIFRVDVSTGSPVITASNTNINTTLSYFQIAVSPDGTRVIPAAAPLASTNPTPDSYNFAELNPSTLTPDGVVYPGQRFPSAVAVSPADGGLLATGLDAYYSVPNISVFRLGVPQPIFTATTKSPSGVANVVIHGLALSADGSRLFAVTHDDTFTDPTEYHLLAFDLSPVSTTTSVTVSPSPSSFGQSVTSTATVSPTDGTGSVAFFVNDTLIAGCSSRPLTTSETGASATATCTTSSLLPGQYIIKAVYSGRAQYVGSSGSTTTTVNPGSTETSVTVAPSPSGFSQSATATATVSPAADSGSVAFFVNETPIAGCSAQPLTTSQTAASATATCTTASLPQGQDVIRAVYSGNARYVGSSGSTTTTVGRGTTTMTASPAQLTKLKGSTYTTTLSAILTSYGAPVSGRTVVFTSGDTPLCSIATDSTGVASCDAVVKTNPVYRSLQKNGYSASFNGDAQYLASSAQASVSG
jgi:Bacterial Ig-like domain (group 3)